MVERTDQPTESSATKPSRLRRIWHWSKVGVKTTLAMVGGYFLIVLVGLVPINNEFAPLKLGDDESVRIFVQSSDVHADILVPLVNEQVDWLDHFPLKEKAHPTDHISFGWGEREFYLETPTWGDLTIRKAVSAVALPTESVMHCSIERPVESETCRSVVISAAQYRDLVDYIAASFQQNSSNGVERASTTERALDPIEIDRAYIHGTWAKHHHFYKARGSYHALNTCNSWVGRGLKRAGIRTAWLTPMPKSVFLYLPNCEEED